MRFERREFPDCRPGTGGIVRSGSRKLIQQRADSLGHFRPRSPLVAVRGDDLERRGIAAHDGGDGVVALLGPVDAGAVPRPGRIRPGPLGGGSRLAAPEVFEIARGDVCTERGVEHPLHGGRVASVPEDYDVQLKALRRHLDISQAGTFASGCATCCAVGFGYS